MLNLPVRPTSQRICVVFDQAFKNIDDVLRKEAGCTTELDYTEQTSWLLFLKYLDGLEQDLADQAALEGKPFTYILDEPYRWASWAAPKGADGKLDHNTALTGDDLRDLVSQDLFPYLHGFKLKASGPHTVEYKIGEIFAEIKNKIQSGYNMREIIDHLDDLRFRARERGLYLGRAPGRRRSAARLAPALSVRARHSAVTAREIAEGSDDPRHEPVDGFLRSKGIRFLEAVAGVQIPSDAIDRAPGLALKHVMPKTPSHRFIAYKTDVTCRVRQCTGLGDVFQPRQRGRRRRVRRQPWSRRRSEAEGAVISFPQSSRCQARRYSFAEEDPPPAAPSLPMSINLPHMAIPASTPSTTSSHFVSGTRVRVVNAAMRAYGK